MTKRFPILAIALVWMLLFLASTSEALAKKSTGTRNFNNARRTFEQLSSNSRTTRHQWLRLIESFLDLSRLSKDPKAKARSVRFAGRACLGLYQSSKRAEDLQRAITIFQKYNKILHRRSPSPPPRAGNKTKLVNSPREVWPKGRASSGTPRARTVAEMPNPASEHTATAQSNPFHAQRSIWGNPFFKQHTGNAAEPQPREVLNESAPETPAQEPRKPPEGTMGITQRVASLIPSRITEATQRLWRKRRSEKSITVVVDPGHGGKDPGAVSRDGSLKEKDVTLRIAKRIKKQLEALNPNVKVVLTRSTDVYLSLPERTAMANSMNADLFISVHCNASTDSSSKGLETYYLSSASSDKAMEVAARENDLSLSSMTDLQATLLDLMMTSKSSESDRLATLVHYNLVHSLKDHLSAGDDRGVKRAPFYVLLGAKMPSILVECYFVSNKKERKRLRNPLFLSLMARGIAAGADKYLKSL